MHISYIIMSDISSYPSVWIQIFYPSFYRSDKGWQALLIMSACPMAIVLSERSGGHCFIDKSKAWSVISDHFLSLIALALVQWYSHIIYSVGAVYRPSLHVHVAQYVYVKTGDLVKPIQSHQAGRWIAHWFFFCSLVVIGLLIITITSPSPFTTTEHHHHHCPSK